MRRVGWRTGRKGNVKDDLKDGDEKGQARRG